jgi:CheY-like chemotaxis protein
MGRAESSVANVEERNVAKYGNAFHLHDQLLHGSMPAAPKRFSLFSGLKQSVFVVGSNPVRDIERSAQSSQVAGQAAPTTARSADGNSPLSPADKRPEFRIASFGMPAKFQRLAEIVTRHAKHNPFKFVLSNSRGPGEFDIALVDMTVTGGPEVAQTLRKLPRSNAVVTVGRRDDDARPKDDLIIANFTLNLLKALNRVVEEQILQRAKAAIPKVAGWAASAPMKWQQLEGQRKPRVLIVDDSPSVRRQLALALQHMGIDSEGVGAAQEALDVLSTRRYDLVFVDVMMPEIDGYKLTKRIKKEKSLKGLPIIILTSRSSPFDLARGALAGCNSYLVKPVSLQSLRATVSRHLLKTIEAQQFGAVRLGSLGTA